MNKSDWIDCLQLQINENPGVNSDKDKLIQEARKRYGSKQIAAYDFGEIRNLEDKVLFCGSTTLFWHRKSEVYTGITDLKNGLYRSFSCDVLDWGPSFED